MEEGYIKLSRRFFDNEIWQAARAFSEAEAWLDLIQSARFDSTRTECSIGAYRPTIGRGQYPASNRFLSKKWGRSEGWVKHFLAKLKKHGMITVDNTQGINVITLTKYDLYNAPCNPPCDPPNDPLRDPLNGLSDSDLQRITAHLVTHLTTHCVTHSPETTEKQRPTNDPNNKKEEESIKENQTTNVVCQKKPDPAAAKAATNKRKEAFYQSLVPFVQQYGKEMVREFFDYWSETNRSFTKMRFEQERTWDLSRRMAYWAKNEKRYGNNSKTGSKAEANAQAMQQLADYIKRRDDGLPDEVQKPW